MPAMQRTLERLSPILRLARVTSAFAVVGNSWFTVLWVRVSANEPSHGAFAERPLALLLAAAALNALGLYVFGASVNDILDLRRDRLLRPERPLAAGSARLGTAITLVALTLLLAVLGASAFGTPGVVLTVVLAAAILAFHGAARFVPGFGIVAFGLIYAGQMLVPGPDARFLWPAWTAMTVMSAVHACAHVLGRKTPPVSRRAWVVTAVGWLFWTGLMLWQSAARNEPGGGVWPAWVSPWAWLGPAGVVVVLAAVCWRKTRALGPGPRLADKLLRYGTLSLSFCAVGWMGGAGHWREAAILGGLAVAGYLGMTVLRELYALLENPVGFRR